jgi:acyl-CoA thioester hydrolase
MRSDLGSGGVHEKQVEIRWKDVDGFGHVNNAVYLTYLEECRDEWLERALGSGQATWDFVLARVAIDFRRELRLEHDTAVVRCRLERIGTASVTTREEIRTADGVLSAEAEAVLVARDRDGGGSRPLRPAEREAIERHG